MNLKRLLWMPFINPNSPDGLIIRAERLEEDAEKLDGELRENMIRYARVLRELALKGWVPAQNKAFIRENLRQT